MSFIVYGQNLKKDRPPWKDAKGVVIDDGVNRPIVLNCAAEKKRAEHFLQQVRKLTGRTWKLWIETDSQSATQTKP